MATRFEWDPVKAAANLRKHGVSFDIALRAFADPFALTEQDRIEDGEVRWQTPWHGRRTRAAARRARVRDEDENGEAIEVVRIISARAADRRERRRYEQETR
jgi:uncharacterized DUF497 family protein